MALRAMDLKKRFKRAKRGSLKKGPQKGQAGKQACAGRPASKRPVWESGFAGSNASRGTFLWASLGKGLWRGRAGCMPVEFDEAERKNPAELRRALLDTGLRPRRKAVPFYRFVPRSGRRGEGAANGNAQSNLEEVSA